MRLAFVHRIGHPVALEGVDPFGALVGQRIGAKAEQMQRRTDDPEQDRGDGAAVGARTAGAVEAIFSVLAIRDQVAPPTINLDEPDEGCDLDFVPHTARSMDIDVVLSNSFGFGGTNGTLAFRRFAG